MARLLDRILVIDVEATCWPRGEEPAGVESEIIEVGVAEVDVAAAAVVGNASLIVRPQRSTISAYCTELTTLTQAQVDAGVTFEEACRVLEGKDRKSTRLNSSH